jgi:hypothetical protein
MMGDVRTSVQRMRTLHVRIPDRLDRALTKRARELKQTKSALARQALARFLSNDPRKPTVGELAGDLIGSVAGPGDLSYNKRHMKGFGL